VKDANNLHANNLYFKISASSVDKDSLTSLVGCLQSVQLLQLVLSRNNTDSGGIVRMGEKNMFVSVVSIIQQHWVRRSHGFTYIARLDLSYNHIGLSGASAEGLKNVSRSNAKIGSSGATDLVDKLHIPDLIALDILHNNVEPSVTDAIETFLKV